MGGGLNAAIEKVKQETMTAKEGKVVGMTKRKSKNKNIARGCGAIMSARKENKVFIMVVRKTKKGLALKRWFKEDWRDVKTGKKCGRQKVKSVVHLIVDRVKELAKNSEDCFGDDRTEKRSRIRQKNRLGQPAGAPEELNH